MVTLALRSKFFAASRRPCGGTLPPLPKISLSARGRVAVCATTSFKVSAMRTAALSIAALSTLMLAGCADDSSGLASGRVELAWRIGPTSCADVGSDEVSVELLGGAANLDGQTVWKFPCSNREGVVSNLRPGSYTFLLAANNPAGDAVFEGATSLVDVRESGTSTPPVVVMRAAPGTAHIEWNFGGPLCSQVDVADVLVMAFDLNGSLEQEATVSCNEGAASLSLRPGSYDLLVLGLSPTGGAAAREAAQRITIERGVTTEISLWLRDPAATIETPSEGTGAGAGSGAGSGDGSGSGF